MDLSELSEHESEDNELAEICLSVLDLSNSFAEKVINTVLERHVGEDWETVQDLPLSVSEGGLSLPAKSLLPGVYKLSIYSAGWLQTDGITFPYICIPLRIGAEPKVYNLSLIMSDSGYTVSMELQPR
jgi:hypothetical protein